MKLKKVVAVLTAAAISTGAMSISAFATSDFVPVSDMEDVTNNAEVVVEVKTDIDDPKAVGHSFIVYPSETSKKIILDHTKYPYAFEDEFDEVKI